MKLSFTKVADLFVYVFLLYISSLSIVYKRPNKGKRIECSAKPIRSDPSLSHKVSKTSLLLIWYNINKYLNYSHKIKLGNAARAPSVMPQDRAAADATVRQCKF